MSTKSLFSPTTNNLKLAFASLGKDVLDVRHFSIHEAMNDLFEVSVLAVSTDDNIDLDSVVGKGAAFKIETGNPLAPVRVWAGVVAHMAQVHAEAAPGVSTYQIQIAPMLWRTALRRNSRIFQHMTTPDIVKSVLAEWQITPVMKLQAAYPAHEYCVQYAETDLAFISRLLEDAGISYSFLQAASVGKGEDITKLVLDDQPQRADAYKGQLPYAGHQVPKFGGASDFCAAVTVTQRMRTGKVTLRDFDFRLMPNLPLLATARGSTREDVYEQYEYVPGAFWWDTDKPEKAMADVDHAPKTDLDESKKLATRTLDAARRRKLMVSFHTSALHIAPGTVVGINQLSPLTANHPRPDLAPDKKLLVVETSIDGSSGGDWSMSTSCVFAEFVYRPERQTAKPRIYGVQSALVVGPAGQEIYTDEYGRVRVQFHWDREGKYDEKSSCWMRVSQPWAGGSFGMLNIPRVGHEVLVEFYEGDPDRPVIVGRVFNGTTVTPWTLPDNQTKSGWRSNSLPSSAKLGYNEISFEDRAGSEEIHVQAEKNLSYIVKNDESSDIGDARKVTIGKADSLAVGQTRAATIGVSDSLDVGMSRTIKVGMTDIKSVGQTCNVSVGPTVGTSMDGMKKKIVITTGGSSITLDGDDIFLNANGEIHIHAKKELHLSSASGDIEIQGGPNVKINPSGSGTSPKIDSVSPAQPPSPPGPPAPGSPGTAPFIPTGGGSIPKPLGVDDVKVDAP
jgi:type VI secretion system secreted protein VgrG